MNERSVAEMVVRGTHIETEIRELPVGDLNYWADNPRVNAAIRNKYGSEPVTQAQIEEELWSKDSVKDLFRDIERQGGLIDEVIVQGKTVLEGNSRLCAYRHLLRRATDQAGQPDAVKWQLIRCRIVPDDLPPESVFSLLGTWHISGKQQWSPYEKAAYLKRMVDAYGWPIDYAANSVGQTVRYVQDNIEALDLMLKNDVYDLEKFSYFFELVKNKNLKEAAPQVPGLYETIVDAIKGDRFDKAENIRDLHKVIKDKTARREFLEEKTTFSLAYQTAKDHHPENAESFYSHLKKATEDLKDCPMTRIEELKTDTQKGYIVKDLKKALDKVLKLL